MTIERFTWRTFLTWANFRMLRDLIRPIWSAAALALTFWILWEAGK